MKKVRRLIALLFMAGFTLAEAFAQQKIVIAVPGFLHPIALVAQRVLPEAYRKIGYDATFEIVPSQRAYAMFDAETVDGFIFSDASFAKAHPNAVMVKTPIGYDNIVVFTKRADIHVKGWQSLSPYLIGYMDGMLVVENNIKGMNGDPAKNPMIAFEKLNAGRDDVVVMPKGVGLMMIKAGHFQGIRILSPALEKVPLYHFVTSKRADIAGKLSAALESMWKSGELQSITDEIDAQFVK